MPSNRGNMGSKVVAVLVMAVAMVLPTAQGEQPEDCRLYQVKHYNPSPIFEVSGGDDTYISLGLLFNDSIATITIFEEVADVLVGDVTTSQSITNVDSSNSCQMSVNKKNGTLQGSCFNAIEIPLKCPQEEGMDTIVLRRRKTLLIAFMDGDASNTHVLTMQSSNIVKVRVTSETFANTAFNCPSNCFQFNNGFIHSIYDLALSAKQIAPGDDGNSIGVVKVFYGEALNESISFNFDFLQNSTQENDESMPFDIDNPQKGVLVVGGDLWKQFDVISQYQPHNDSTYFLYVSGSLIGSEDPFFIGSVPTLDTYFKFEDMDNILWTTCPNITVTDGSTTESMSGVTQGMSASSSEGKVDGLTEETTTAADDQNVEDVTLETGVGVAIKETGEPSTALPVESTTKRFIEEMSCKDTWDPKCTLTKKNNGSCDCGEAKANGWCDDLVSHPHVKENCKKTCGLCPDQVGVINGRSNGITSEIDEVEGGENFQSSDSVVATQPPKTRNTNGNIFVYMMIAIVVVMLLVLIIWLTCKKRKASGRMDLEGQSQSMLLKESSEKTSENNKDAELSNKTEKEDNNEGAKNDTFQEKDEVKETTKLNDEKANADDGEKGAGENSPTKDENDSKKGAGENSPTKDENDSKDGAGENESKGTADKSPTNKEIEHATEKGKEDKANNEEYKKDDANHGDESPNGEPEKSDKVENENENASKGITDSIENEKTIE